MYELAKAVKAPMGELIVCYISSNYHYILIEYKQYHLGTD